MSNNLIMENNQFVLRNHLYKHNINKRYSKGPIKDKFNLRTLVCIKITYINYMCMFIN